MYSNFVNSVSICVKLLESNIINFFMSKQVIHTFRESVVRDITSFGGFPFFGVVILFLFLLGNKTAVISELLIGIIIIMAISVLTRSFYYKPRPKELPHNTWLEKIEASSFPSIHAARACFLAIVFGYFFDNTSIWILLVISAFAVCYSRYHMRRHDVWDLLAGTFLAFISYRIVLFLVNFLAQRQYLTTF